MQIFSDRQIEQNTPAGLTVYRQMHLRTGTRRALLFNAKNAASGFSSKRSNLSCFKYSLNNEI